MKDVHHKFHKPHFNIINWLITLKQKYQTLPQLFVFCDCELNNITFQTGQKNGFEDVICTFFAYIINQMINWTDQVLINYLIN